MRFTQGFFGQGQGNGFELNGCGLCVAKVGHSLDQFWCQAQQHKTIGLLGRDLGIDGFVVIDIGCIKRQCFGYESFVRRGLRRRQVGLHFKSVSHIFSRTDVRKICGGAVHG